MRRNTTGVSLEGIRKLLYFCARWNGGYFQEPTGHWCRHIHWRYTPVAGHHVFAVGFFRYDCQDRPCMNRRPVYGRIVIDIDGARAELEFDSAIDVMTCGF